MTPGRTSPQGPGCSLAGGCGKFCSEGVVLFDGPEVSSGRTDSRAMFNPLRKQAVPAIAAATASQRKGLRHLVRSSGRSNLNVRLRYAKKALVSPRVAPTPKTIIASAKALKFAVVSRPCANATRRTIAATPFNNTISATPRLAYLFRCLSTKMGSIRTMSTSSLMSISARRLGGIVIGEPPCSRFEYNAPRPRLFPFAHYHPVINVTV